MTTESTGVRLGDLLTGAGLLKPTDLREAMLVAKQQGLPVGRVLIMSAYLSEHQLQAAVKAQSMLKDGLIDQETVIKALTLVGAEDLSLEEALKSLQWYQQEEIVTNKLGELLFEASIIDKTQLQQALAQCQAIGLPLGRVLVITSILSEQMLAAALNAQVLVRDHKISRDQALQGLRSSKDRQIPIEQYLAENGLLQLPTKDTIRLGELLVETGVVDEPSVMNAVEIGLLNEKPIGQVMVELGLITETLLNNALTVQNLVSDAELKKVDAARVLRLVHTKKRSVEAAMQEVHPLPASKPDAPQPLTEPLPLYQFLQLAGLIAPKDIETAVRMGSKDPDIMGRMLVHAEILPLDMVTISQQANELICQGILNTEQGIMAVKTCRTNGITLEETFTQLNWDKQPLKTVEHWLRGEPPQAPAPAESFSTAEAPSDPAPPPVPVAQAAPQAESALPQAPASAPTWGKSTARQKNATAAPQAVPAPEVPAPASPDEDDVTPASEPAVTPASEPAPTVAAPEPDTQSGTGWPLSTSAQAQPAADSSTNQQSADPAWARTGDTSVDVVGAENPHWARSLSVPAPEQPAAPASIWKSPAFQPESEDTATAQGTEPAAPPAWTEAPAQEQPTTEDSSDVSGQAPAGWGEQAEAQAQPAPQTPTWTAPAEEQPQTPTWTPPTEEQTQTPTWTPPAEEEPQTPTWTPPAEEQPQTPTWTPPSEEQPQPNPADSQGAQEGSPWGGEAEQQAAPGIKPLSQTLSSFWGTDAMPPQTTVSDGTEAAAPPDSTTWSGTPAPAQASGWGSNEPPAQPAPAWGVSEAAPAAQSGTNWGNDTAQAAQSGTDWAGNDAAQVEQSGANWAGSDAAQTGQSGTNWAGNDGAQAAPQDSSAGLAQVQQDQSVSGWTQTGAAEQMPSDGASPWNNPDSTATIPPGSSMGQGYLQQGDPSHAQSPANQDPLPAPTTTEEGIEELSSDQEDGKSKPKKRLMDFMPKLGH